MIDGTVSDAVLRKIGDRIFSRGSGRFAVLIYHRVLPEPDPLFPEQVDKERFELHLRALMRFFNVMLLGEALERRRSGSLPPRTACITFDDGYADNAEIALPLLAAKKLKATFFIATGFLNGGAMWNDVLIHALRDTTRVDIDLKKFGLERFALVSTAARSAAIRKVIGAVKYRPPAERRDLGERVLDLCDVAPPQNLMMMDEQVRRLHTAGMEIGAHTCTHPILTAIADSEAEEEIAAGRDQLEALTGERPRLFAYPNGRPHLDYRREHVDLVRNLGFTAAVSTSWGAPSARADTFQIPRFTPWDHGEQRFAGRLLHNALLRRPTLV
jgi:peptidoglycan/xylan/chitin deacetylase (PgdA/CDA1 family)